MDKGLIRRVFGKIKDTIPGIDYAIVDTDEYGDCHSCVNAAISIRYGEDSKGIFLKHWAKGMNRSKPLKYQEKAYIAHDLTDEQGTLVLEMLKAEFDVENEKYDPDRCFVIRMKPALQARCHEREIEAAR